MTLRYRPLAATILILVASYAAAVLQFPSMLSVRVLTNLLTDNSFLGIVAVGATFVIISGGIDLSVGAVVGFTSVLLSVLITWFGIPPLIAFALALVIATLFGASMGVLIHYLKVPPFIVTLAGMFLARGAASAITQDSIPINHPLYHWISSASFKFEDGARLSMIGILMLLTFIVGGVILHRTRFGSYVYALGGNPVSAQLMGVPIAKTTISIYAISSFLGGLAGIVYSLYTSAGYPLAAVGLELDSIAAVVIGGTLLSGGYGFMLGSFVGVILQGLVQTYIVFDGTLSSWWTKIVIGFLLFLFIVLQRLVFRSGFGRSVEGKYNL